MNQTVSPFTFKLLTHGENPVTTLLKQYCKFAGLEGYVIFKADVLIKAYLAFELYQVHQELTREKDMMDSNYTRRIQATFLYQPQLWTSHLWWCVKILNRLTSTFQNFWKLCKPLCQASWKLGSNHTLSLSLLLCLCICKMLLLPDLIRPLKQAHYKLHLKKISYILNLPIVYPDDLISVPPYLFIFSPSYIWCADNTANKQWLRIMALLFEVFSLGPN